MPAVDMSQDTLQRRGESALRRAAAPLLVGSVRALRRASTRGAKTRYWLLVATSGVTGPLLMEISRSRAAEIQRVGNFLSRRLQIGTEIRSMFLDEQADQQAVSLSWMRWRTETARGLPRRYRQAFPNPDAAARQAFATGRLPTNGREAAVLSLDWDLDALRRIQGADRGENL